MDERAATPEQILSTCIGLEEGAAAMYCRFAEIEENPRLQRLWRAMEQEEKSHAETVLRIKQRPKLELPVIGREELAALVTRVGEIRAESQANGLDATRMLSIAAAVEFSEMDDLLGAICRAAGIDPEQGRAAHLAGLCDAAAEIGASGSALRHLLASVVRLDRRARGGAAWPVAWPAASP